MPKTDSINSKLSDTLWAKAVRGLEERLRTDAHLTADEVAEVSGKRTNLFPPGFVLTSRETDLFRKLALFSQVELRPAPRIVSHRRFLGPVIVFLKKLTFPLVAIHLKESYAGMKEFCSAAVTVMAEQAVVIRELEERAKKG